MKVQIKDGGYLIDDSIMLYEGSTSPLWEELQEWLVEYIPLPEYTEEEIEAQRLLSINGKVESIIINPYPIYKQLNIRGLLSPFTLQDLEVMDMFIDTVRQIGKNAKESGITVDEINWGGLDEYTSHDEIIKDTIVSIRKDLKID